MFGCSKESSRWDGSFWYFGLVKGKVTFHQALISIIGRYGWCLLNSFISHTYFLHLKRGVSVKRLFWTLTTCVVGMVQLKKDFTFHTLIGRSDWCFLNSIRSYISNIWYVLGVQKSHLSGMVLLSTHNMSCCLVKGNMIFHITLLSVYLVDMYSKTFYKPHIWCFWCSKES